MDLSAFCAEQDIELSAVQLVDQGIIVLSLYRSPSGNIEKFFSALDNCLTWLANFKKNIVLGGDFNIHINVVGGMSDMLDIILKSHGLFIASRTPTRGKYCLDTVATSLNSWDYRVAVADPLIADHCPVTMDVSTELVSVTDSFSWYEKYTRTLRDISEDKLPCFKAALAEIDWTSLRVPDNPELSFEAFFDKFKEIFDRVFPSKTLPRRPIKKLNRPTHNDKNRNLWYTDELFRLKKFVVSVHDRYKISKHDSQRAELYSLYLLAKRHYRIKVDLAKKHHNMKEIEGAKNPCKAAWNLVNRTCKTKSAMKCAATPDQFNEYLLAEVERTINSSPVAGPGDDGFATVVPVSILGPHQFNNWTAVSSKQVLHVIRQFKNSQSQDIYGMNIIVLKYVADVIAYPLAVVLGACMRSGTFPELLKVSRTVPIYKKGDPEDIGSYRPISVIPVFAKVYETLMKMQIVHYFESRNLFADSQHGFRRNRSTVSAVLKLVTEILNTFEAGCSMALTLADLSKAFDCVSHSQLLDKLQLYGVGGVVLKVFHSYLSNRKQIMAVGGAHSQPKPVQHGVPQGSVIGPVLFLVTINDLSQLGNVLLFADDTSIYASGVTHEEAKLNAQQVFSGAKDWFLHNKLSLNETKTQQMICSLSKSDNSIEQDPIKLLGFTLDPKLTWRSHISNVSKKLARTLHLLRRLKPMLSKEYIVTVYHAMFHSHLSYGIELWGHAAGIIDILLLQKKALRVMSSSGYSDHCRPIFVDLKILTVYGQYILSSLTYLKSTISLYSTRDETHSYNTRTKLSLDLPYCRLSKKKNCYPMLTLKMYNALPVDMRNLEPKRFRCRLKDWLLARPFYSVDEFFSALV